MNEPIWQPSPRQVADTNMTAFMEFVQDREKVVCADYDLLWQWSIDQPTRFWPAVWHFCDVRCSTPWDQVLVDGDKMPEAKWFIGARLNFAENLLKFDEQRAAIISWTEQGFQRRLSFAELRAEVARIARWLRELGVASGDRVAALTPNIQETVVTMLGCASIGAIFSSCSPDFGVEAIVERFGQIKPVVLLVADGYQYGGKSFNSLQRAQELTARIPSIRHTVVVPYSQPAPSLEGLTNAVLWDSIGPCEAEIEFEQLPFDHPLYILYSSGTTGKPKCIVHGAGGTLLQHLKEHVLHTDLGVDDRLFYFTTCGWMMWNWLVSGLAAGTTVVLYDGAPFFPNEQILFDMIDDEDVTVFGTSASYIAALEKAGQKPAETHRLDSLRAVLSTGSPLAPENFDYVYTDIKRDLQLASISGGTDIVSCFALGNPNSPVRRGELQCRGLAMDVDVMDENGNSLVGQKGELVCKRPFPSMPVAFWDDPGDEKYHSAYFERFPGVWWHGDFAERTPNGGMIIYGRSDAVLNPGGVRIGTAEIYAQANALPEVVDSIAIGQEWEGDVRVVLFVRLRAGCTLDDQLREQIRKQIRTGASPRHVPAKIVPVADIPRTRSGKIVELSVREIVHGRPVKNLDALANPETLDEFRDRPELQS